MTAVIISKPGDNTLDTIRETSSKIGVDVIETSLYQEGLVDTTNSINTRLEISPDYKALLLVKIDGPLTETIADHLQGKLKEGVLGNLEISKLSGLVLSIEKNDPGAEKIMLPSEPSADNAWLLQSVANIVDLTKENTDLASQGKSRILSGEEPVDQRLVSALIDETNGRSEFMRSNARKDVSAKDFEGYPTVG